MICPHRCPHRPVNIPEWATLLPILTGCDREHVVPFPSIVSSHLVAFRRSPSRRTLLPWAQGVGRSNRPAPTNSIKKMRATSGVSQTTVDKFVAVELLKLHRRSAQIESHTFRCVSEIRDNGRLPHIGA